MLTAGVPRIQSLLGMHNCTFRTKGDVGRAFSMLHISMLICVGLLYEHRILGNAGAGICSVLLRINYSTLDVKSLYASNR